MQLVGYAAILFSVSFLSVCITVAASKLKDTYYPIYYGLSCVSIMVLTMLSVKGVAL